MATEFRFPDVGEGITEGTLVRWKVKEGDTVKADQPLADIETDKAIVAIPSPQAGKLLKLYGEPGQTVKVGAVLALIGNNSDSPPKEKKQEAAEKPRKDAGAVVGQLPEYEEPKLPEHHYFFLKTGESIKSLTELQQKIAWIDQDTFSHHVNDYKNDFANWIKEVLKDAELAEKVKAIKTREDLQNLLAIKKTPLVSTKQKIKPFKAMPGVKKLAKEKGIDLSTIQGSGKDGEITKKDLETSKSEAKTVSSAGVTEKSSGVTITKREYDLFGY